MPIVGLKSSVDFLRCDTYRMPNRMLNVGGDVRKVGVEIEFAGLDNNQAIQALHDELGGTIETTGLHLSHLRGSDLGDIEIMLDTQYAHPDSSHEPKILKEGRELLGTMVSGLVPQEIVTEPITFDRLHQVERITSALTKAGAVGTQENIAFAFGLHLNAEIASETAEYLLSIIRSMIILDPQIREACDPDTSRRIMGWAKSYTEPYAMLVTNPDYKPNMKQLVTDFVELNEGRSYHLDMLPVFRHIAPETMDQLIGQNNPASRPAFHFRLPDSGLGDPSWSIKDNWNLWVEIENYAEEIGEEHLRLWRKANGIW